MTQLEINRERDCFLRLKVMEESYDNVNCEGHSLAVFNNDKFPGGTGFNVWAMNGMKTLKMAAIGELKLAQWSMP